MNDTKRRSGKRPKKYKFKGNQFTMRKAQRLSASAKKLDPKVQMNADFHGYSIIDKDVIFSFLENYLSCSVCHSSVKIVSAVIYGLLEKITITCTNCGILSSCQNSVMTGVKKNRPEINTRFTYAMRCIGQGFLGAKTFCGVMDLPPPVSKAAYNKIVNRIANISTISAEKSMVCAANEEMLSEGSSHITISGDGTWKTRGHSSLIGVCTVVGATTGKVIDTEVLSSHCKGCEVWKGTRFGSEYEEWKEKHSNVCQKNHDGSAGMMEVVGMTRIFHRSQSKRSVQYAKYIGDGDCKTFTTVEKSEPYGKDYKICKIECVGHIQKRMGARLRKRKHDLRGKKLNDGKPIGGKGRLTDAVIDKLTVYYGNAIRKHSHSAKEMQAAVWAIFYHKRSTDKEPLHNFCPKGVDSWCPYQKAKASKKVYKHVNSVPPAIMDAIKDIFKDLSMPNLLQKCLGGQTQNSNESLNALIWKFCPKTSGSGKQIVQIAVNEAIICYNEGQIGRLSTMRDLEFQIGQFCHSYAVEVDTRRIFVAEKRAAQCTLEARRAKRMCKKSAEESLQLKEGTVYAAGEF